MTCHGCIMDLGGFWRGRVTELFECTWSWMELCDDKTVPEMPEEARQIAWWPHYSLICDTNEFCGCCSIEMLREAEIVVRKCRYCGQDIEQKGANGAAEHMGQHTSQLMRDDGGWDWALNSSNYGIFDDF